MPEPLVETPAPAPPARRTVYTKTVDLGDGHPQVFKASTKDELIEKIYNAQVSASKRINELKQENKRLQKAVEPDPAQPTRQYEPRSLSQDEELELANEITVNPTSAISKALKATLGMDPDELRKKLSKLDEIEQKEVIKAIGGQFIAAHPEYPISDANEKLMSQYIQKNKLAWTLKNLELAFADLVEAGLVTPIGAHVEEVEEEIEVPAAVVQPVAPVIPVQPPAELDGAQLRRRKAVVGISTSQAVATVNSQAPHEASVEDLLKVPLSERRRIVLAQMSRQV